MNNMDELKIKVKLLNWFEQMEVTSINFKERTFTWDYKGTEQTESFDAVVSWEVTQ